MNESQHESSSNENDIEIIDLDAQRPRRFSSIPVSSSDAH